MIDCKNITTDIVRESVATAICIDDEFLEFYDEPKDGLNKEIPYDLFNTFKENGCILDVNRYTKDFDMDKLNNYLDNKDLLILDWELNKFPPKYINSLKILEEAVLSDNIFCVCIYTNEPDIETRIIPQLFTFFSGNKKEDIEEWVDDIFNEIETNFAVDDATKIFERAKIDCFFETLKMDNQRNVTNQLLTSTEKFGIVQKDFSKFKKIVEKHGKRFDLNLVEALRNIFLSMGNFFEFNSKRKLNLCLLNDEQNVLFIGGTLVLISSKKLKGEELFEKISETIAKRPGSIFSLLQLELRSKYRKRALTIGKDIADIDESALLYFYKNEANIELFEELMIDIWNEKISVFSDSDELDFKNILDNKIGEFNSEEFIAKTNAIDKLAELNAYFSMQTLNRANNSLRFGDIFTCEFVDQEDTGDVSFELKKYLICITPHCDCLRPKKINNNFYFVFGNEMKFLTALEHSESGYCSFLKKNNEVKAIEWDCSNVTTMYIKEEQNNVENEIICYYSGRKIKLKQIALLKENYTQRIANKSTSEISRVGISLASKKADKKSEKEKLKEDKINLEKEKKEFDKIKEQFEKERARFKEHGLENKIIEGDGEQLNLIKK